MAKKAMFKFQKDKVEMTMCTFLTNITKEQVLTSFWCNPGGEETRQRSGDGLD